MPRLSFIVLTYNQESIVRESLLSVLNQEGEPIEIIVSDDASRDRTPQIVEELLGSYNGPHRVIFNSNKVNLGIALNFQKAVGLSTGDWIVAAGGDDISSPLRARAIRDVATQNPLVAAICSQYRIQQPDGSIAPTNHEWNARMSRMQDWTPEKILLSVCLGRPMIMLHGAATAWRRDLLEKYPPLTSVARGVSEDGILRWRALVMGKIFFIREPLVTYRRASGSVTHVAGHLDPLSRARSRKRLVLRALRTLEQSRREFAWARDNGLLCRKKASKCISRISYLIAYRRAQLSYDSSGIFKKACMLAVFLPAGIWRKFLRTSA